jgi:hypothetical protein
MNTQRDINRLLPAFVLIGVVFASSATIYTYRFRGDVAVGDLVVVDSPYGWKVTKVVAIETKTSYTGALKWAVCKVDTTMRDAWVAEEDKLRDALEALDEAVEDQKLADKLTASLNFIDPATAATLRSALGLTVLDDTEHAA